MNNIALRPFRRTPRYVARKIDLTKGSIPKVIALFFLPILLGSLMQQLYVTVDAIIIGKFVGKVGLAGIDSVFNLCRLPVTFFVGLSAGASIVVAQSFGARNLDRLSRMTHTSIVFSVVTGVIMTVLGLATMFLAVDYLHVPTDIRHITLSYLGIYFAGLTFVTIYNLASGVLRATGDSTTPFWALGIASLVNIVLDLIFVPVFHWGVPGAAVATLLAQACSAIYVLRAMFKVREPVQDESPELLEACRLKRGHFKMHKSELKSIMSLGLPVAIQSSLYVVANIYVQRSINSTGTDNIAAWSLCGKFDIFVWLIIEALTVVVTTFVAQNYGAGLYDRMKKGAMFCLVAGSSIVLAMGLVLFFFGEQLGWLFLGAEDYEVIVLGAKFMQVIALFYVVAMPSEILSSVIRGMGTTIQPMVITLLSIFVTRIIWISMIFPVWPHGFVFAGIRFPVDYIYGVISVYPISWTMVSLCITGYYLYFRHRYITGRKPVEEEVY